MKDIGDAIRKHQIKVAFTTALAATTTLGNLVYAQDSSVNASSNPTEISEQTPDKVELNPNPLNIKDEHWVAMKGVAEAVKQNPNPQVIYREVILDDKGDKDPSNDEIDRQIRTSIVHQGLPDEYWRLSQRHRPPTAAGKPVVPNITTLDDYIQRLAIQKGETGVYVGVIDVSVMRPNKRLTDFTERLQDTINFHKKFNAGKTAPFISGVFKIIPSGKEWKLLSEAQKENGIILYVRGTRFGDLNNTLLSTDGSGFNFDEMLKSVTLATGIYVDDDEVLRKVEHVWREGLTHMNNAEYAAYVQQGLEEQNSAQNVQGIETAGDGGGSDSGKSGTSSAQTEVEDSLVPSTL